MRFAMKIIIQLRASKLVVVKVKAIIRASFRHFHTKCINGQTKLLDVLGFDTSWYAKMTLQSSDTESQYSAYWDSVSEYTQIHYR